MIYIKKLNDREKQKMRAINNIPDIRRVALPSVQIGSFSVMPWAKTMSDDRRPAISELIPNLKMLYTIRVPHYSEGIYSFARKGLHSRTDEEYYKYINTEIELLLEKTTVINDLCDVFIKAKQMWESAIENYKNTYYYRFELLHGDLHTGNIVYYLGKCRFIDWEHIRSAPKEMELSFYLIWCYCQNEQFANDFSQLRLEIEELLIQRLISKDEKERIERLLIPMWFLITICYISNGNLMYAEKRIKALNKYVPLYYKEWSQMR